LIRPFIMSRIEQYLIKALFFLFIKKCNEKQDSIKFIEEFN
jgi:hypothetical protein